MQGFDFTGLVSLATFLGALEYVLEEGPRNDWLHYTPISVMAIVSIIGAMVFFWRTLTYHNPIVDITAFADRNFALSSFFSLLLVLAFTDRFTCCHCFWHKFADLIHCKLARY